MALCDLITTDLISPCIALQAAGGVQDFCYVLENVEDLVPTYTANVLTGFTLAGSPGTVLLTKLTGKRLQNSGNGTLVVSDDRRKFFPHEVKFGVYANAGADLLVIEKLAKVQKCVIFLPLNDKTIRVYGLDYGMQATALETPTGVKIEDNIAKMITFTDVQDSLPKQFLLTGGYATSIAELEANTWSNF
jgi:phosphosulfolactate phosphohydrolase-like enzyme